MKERLIQIGSEIAKLSADELSQLESLLIDKHGIMATIYGNPNNLVLDETNDLPFGGTYDTDKFFDDDKAVWSQPYIGTTINEESGFFNVRLIDGGNSKLRTVKCIKELTGNGLKESKRIMDNIPSYVVQNVSRSQAEIVCTELRKVGARVQIV